MFKKLATATAALLVAFMPLMSTTVHAATATNLITNPGVETDTTGWTSTSWSTNTKTFTHPTTGNTTPGSLQVDITSAVTATSGADGWSTSSIALTAGQSYQFSFWYKSTAAAELDAEVMVNNVAQPRYVAALPVSANWTQYQTTYTAVAGETSIIYTPLLVAKGSLTTDDFNFSTYTPTPLNRALISVSFDDGWVNQYANAAPVLAANNIKATYNVLSGETKNADTDTGSDRTYMNSAEVKALYTQGNEIASHTIDHCSLTGNSVTNGAGSTCPMPMTAAALKSEMETSKKDLETIIGAPGAVTDFAYPYGEYDATSIAAGQAAGYTSQRTVEQGYNSTDNIGDYSKLKAYEVDTTTTNAQVEAWIQGAIAQKSWIILFYHEVANTAFEGDEGYNATVANFTAQMAYINANRAAIAPVTVAQAISEIKGGVVVTPPVTKPGDVNGDNLVDEGDLSVMFSNWGKANATKAQGNLNGDTTVDEGDLSVLFTNWSK
jgi:peptidoglycan/xylan/chitin deacetylase (PgdA/CDA1 family)